jgi:hypothetical protein
MVPGRTVPGRMEVSGTRQDVKGHPLTRVHTTLPHTRAHRQTHPHTPIPPHPHTLHSTECDDVPETLCVCLCARVRWSVLKLSLSVYTRVQGVLLTSCSLSYN